MFRTFHINYRSADPIYQQIYNEVVKQISLGLVEPDHQLTTVRELAANLGINPNTVSKAYHMLEQDGYIYSAVGRGSFIADCSHKLGVLKENALQQLAAALEKCRDLSIPQDTIKTLADKIYFGGGSDHA